MADRLAHRPIAPARPIKPARAPTNPSPLSRNPIPPAAAPDSPLPHRRFDLPMPFQRLRPSGSMAHPATSHSPAVASRIPTGTSRSPHHHLLQRTSSLTSAPSHKDVFLESVGANSSHLLQLLSCFPQPSCSSLAPPPLPNRPDGTPTKLAAIEVTWHTASSVGEVHDQDLAQDF